ncbi:MAG: OsmC family protein [Candidatus Omnitrophota bacterium]
MYHVVVSHREGYEFNVRSKNGECSIGLKGKSISPPDALLASLGSCIGVYLRKYAEGATIDIPNFEVDVQAEFSKEKPVSFRDIQVTIVTKNSAIGEERKGALISFIKNCPVHNTLKERPSVSITVQ